MKAKRLSGLFTVLAIILLIISLFMLYAGHDKMTNYRNSEYNTSKNVNAYVGGDAYNYIINGNYATGYFVLAMGSFTSCIVCAGISAVLAALNELSVSKNKEETNNE